MASIITATTTSGLTHSADNSGVLQLASGTGNLVTIPSVTGTVMVSGNMPAFSAYQSVQQSGISAWTPTKITFTTEDFDTNNNFASSRFTPTVAGYYQINYQLQVQSANTNAYMLALLYKNGTQISQGSLSVGVGSAHPNSSGSKVVYMNGSSDYLEVYAYGTGGSSTYSLEAAVAATNFSGCLLRAA